MSDTALPPSPEGGWSERVEVLSDAAIHPADASGFIQPAGILRADGSYCDLGAFWRNRRALSIAPEPQSAPADTLPGRWLWGGVLWVHFGHFLVESTGRLWGVDAADGPLDGIAYIPKRPKRGDQIERFQHALFELCGIDLPVRVLTRPTTVEEIVVPGQGFGLGDIIRGTPSFRTWMHDRFARDVAADGPENLYISRSKLGLNKGGLVGEAQLESRLADEGYEVFHPQEHDMTTQIARYKAARRIVAAEGSALHLFGFVGQPHQKVAIVVRRQSGATQMIVEHLRSFCGIDPMVAEALQSVFMLKGGHKKRHDLGVLDMPALQRMLSDQGFVSESTGWDRLEWRQIKAVIGGRYKRRGPVRTRARAAE